MDCYRVALMYLKEEGRLQVGLQKAISNNMKAAIHRLANSNSTFRQLNLRMPPSDGPLYKQLFNISQNVTKSLKPPKRKSP